MIEKHILDFLKNDVGIIIINDEDKNFISGAEDIKLSEKGKRLWKQNLPSAYIGQRGEEWELYDSEREKYYRVTTSSFENGSGLIQISFMLDITEYTSVFKNISGLSANWERSSKFQTSLIKNLSGSYDTLLSDISGIFGCSGTVLYTRSAHGAYKMKYENESFEKTVIKDNEDIFEKCAGDICGNYFCYLSSSVGNQSYLLFISEDKREDENNTDDINLRSVIRLFIENSLLNEQVVYESEHDKMTGLYNKGKYMSLLGEHFGIPNSIAVFNMDVNNLKHMNDTYGHEMGDRLIIKAAESLKALQSDNVMGFRTGGDEFMLIAKDIDLIAAQELRSRWEQETEKLNKRDDGIPLVIACGMSFGEGSYDINSLLFEADKLMYEDKQNKKQAAAAVR